MYCKILNPDRFHGCLTAKPLSNFNILRQPEEHLAKMDSADIARTGKLIKIIRYILGVEVKAEAGKLNFSILTTSLRVIQDRKLSEHLLQPFVC